MPENSHHHDIQKLIGGFATGTLSEAQRRKLFEAALDDQELFDELARDQGLKELLAAPGVKQRLLASIEVRPARVWWKHPLPWAMGGFALAVSAVLLAIVYYTPSGSRPVEVAQFKAPERPGTVIGESPGLPELQNEPRAGTRAGGSGGGGGGGAKAKPAAKASPAVSPGTGPAPIIQNEPKPSQPSDKTASNPPPEIASRDVGTANTVGALAVPGAPPAPAPAPISTGGPVAGFVPGPAPPPSSPAAPGAGGAARPMAAARAALPPAPAAGRLAFDYNIYDGVLRIVPAADGYVLVRATVHDDDRLLLRTSHVKGNAPLELGIPEGATFLAIVLSPRPMQEESTENLAARLPARTEMAGHLEDPRPTLTSRVEARIRLK